MDVSLRSWLQIMSSCLEETMPDSLKVITAAEIMIENLTTVRGGWSVQSAVEILLKNRISGAPVVDEHHNLIGILSEKDCIYALTNAIVEGLPFANVEAAMTHKEHLTTITENTDLLTIAHIFINHSFRRLPVLRGARLVGQISRRDLLGSMNKRLNSTKSGRFKAIPLYVSALKRSLSE